MLLYMLAVMSDTMSVDNVKLSLRMSSFAQKKSRYKSLGPTLSTGHKGRCMHSYSDLPSGKDGNIVVRPDHLLRVRNNRYLNDML